MTIHSLFSGSSGLLVTYLVVALPMLLGLLQERAAITRFLSWPILAAPVAILAALFWSMIVRSAEHFTAASITAWSPTAAAAMKTTGLAVLILFGYFGGRLAARVQPNESHKRGTVIDDGKAAQRKSVRLLRRDTSTLSLAGIALPQLDETKHFKLIGTTGTGKTTAIRELLGRALARGDRAIIADPDGGYATTFYDATRGDVILNPFDSRSKKWDLFAEIAESYDVNQLARSLIPDIDDARASEWRAYARTFLTAVIRQLHEGGMKSLDDLYRLLTSASTDELRILLAGTPAQPFLESDNARMFGSIRSVTSQAVTALEYIADQPTDTPAISIRHWVQRGQDGEKRGVLFLPYRADQIAALRSAIAAWLRIAIFECMSQPEGDQRLWFIVDELDALGPIDGLKDALARLRKFGGRCVLGFQSIAQVSNTYGSGEARTIVENCGNSLILRCSASEGGGTARFASQLIGDRQLIRTTTSRSRSREGVFGAGEMESTRTESEHHVTEPAVLPSEIEQLPDLSGYLKFASSPTWLRLSLSLPAH